MKKKNVLRDLFGLTQEDLALLLNVSRSHLSLFELGKRGLPLEAKLLFADLSVHATQSKTLPKDKIYLAQQKNKQQQCIKSMLHENEFRQSRIDKKIVAAKKKYSTMEKTLKSANFVILHTKNDGFAAKELFTSIASKTTKAMEVEGLAFLSELDLKKELLVRERAFLESELRKL